MNVRSVLLGLVGAAIGWLEPGGGEDMADLVSREGRTADDGVIVGSPASGYHSEGGHFYTWQPERAEVVDWVAALAPCDPPARPSRG